MKALIYQPSKTAMQSGLSKTHYWLVEYEPEEISYKDLLKVFFENHNPTTSNRQGPDIGIQYRSAIFYHDSEQEKLAKEVKEKLNPIAKERFGNEIVTEIKSAVPFYRAEEYHQKYFQKH